MREGCILSSNRRDNSAAFCWVQTKKTYHTYFGDSQQAETKLKRAESQRVKSDQSTNVIGRRFRRDYDKLSEKVWIFAGFWFFLFRFNILI